jgi:hypothetical protein
MSRAEDDICHGRASAAPACDSRFLTIRYQNDITFVVIGWPTPQLTGGIPMNSPTDDSAPEGLRGWWASPPRSGLRRIISPWEYRHLRSWARVRIATGTVLVGLGVVTLSFGGNDWKTYGWTMAFLALAAAQFSFASWELAIARSESASA